MGILKKCYGFSNALLVYEIFFIVFTPSIPNCRSVITVTSLASIGQCAGDARTEVKEATLDPSKETNTGNGTREYNKAWSIHEKSITSPTHEVKGFDEVPRRERTTLSRVRTGNGGREYLLHEWKTKDDPKCDCDPVHWNITTRSGWVEYPVTHERYRLNLDWRYQTVKKPECTIWPINSVILNIYIFSHNCTHGYMFR